MFNLAAKARPYFGAVVLSTLLLSAGGVYCATRMASGVYPEVTFPRIAVTAKKPGLDLVSTELQITVPLEQAVTTVVGVESVRAKTIRGACDLSINFTPGTDMKRAEQLTWNRIGAARSSLPADLELEVEQQTPSVSPIMSLILVGGASASSLRDYAFYELMPRIKNIPDVLYCKIAGGDIREIKIEPRPDDLLAAGLSAADLADQISKMHRLQPVGRIEEPPFAFQILVNTQQENVRHLEELVIGLRNNQPLRVRDVADVRIAHTDRMESIGFDGKDAVVLTIYRRLGGNTVSISSGIKNLLQRQPPPTGIQWTLAYDQSRFISTAVENVRDAILIGGLFSIVILLAFLRSWRATLISALAIPVTLAITFLFLYWSGETFNLMSLGGLAVAIGLIIDDTVVVIENIARHLEQKVKGFSGPAPSPPTPLPLSTGGEGSTDPFVPSPLYSEERGRGEEAGNGRDQDPVMAASGEITGAVVGSTLTTVLVFIPLVFLSGVYGQFFLSLNLALCIAVLVSMVVSLTLIPVLAAKFLAGRPMPPPGPIYRAVARVYDAALMTVLRFPWPTLTLSVAAMGLGVLLYTGIPSFGPGNKAPLVKGLETGLMPAMDEGAFVLDYFAPTGTPLRNTEQMARTIEKILSAHPDVQAYVRRSGTQLGLLSTKTDRGDIQVILRPADNDPISLLTKPVRPPLAEMRDELRQSSKEPIQAKYRRRPMSRIMQEIEDEIHDRFSEHQLRIELVQIITDELNDMSGLNDPIELKFFGPDYKVLREVAEEVGDMLESRGKGRGIKEVNTNVHGGVPDLMVRVDGVKAARYGLTAMEIERQLRAIYLGQEATKVRESALRITDVDVCYSDLLRFGRGRFNPDMVRNQWILLPEGTGVRGQGSGVRISGGIPDSPMAAQSPDRAPYAGSFKPLSGPSRIVPLSAVATIEPVRTPDEQARENQQPAIFVTTQLAEEEAGLGSVVADIRRWMSEREPLPAGYRWELGGHYVKQQEAFQSLAMIMIVAVMLVIIMLAIQFRSVLLPLLIFLTQPLSLVSGLFALWITHTPLNVSSYMGAILLIGLDMKNGILLVEYIQQLRAEGMPLRPALLLAGRTRFRPILMTSLAAILGLLPLALGIGPGAQMQQPLAIMVIGGLTANMLFTRLVIPAGYLVMERSKTRTLPTAPPTA
jgi:multidrug efflux pump subunit AcrB